MDLKQMNEELNRYVKPLTFPLALKLYKADEKLPAKVKMPMKDMGYPMTLCQVMGMSRRFGQTFAVGEDDQCCLGGALTMGFLAEPPKGSMFSSSTEVRLEAGKYSNLVMASLERADFEPDIIVIYGNSAQIARLAQSASFFAKFKVASNVTGFVDCGDIVARTHKSKECQFILPSGGDRIFGSTQDHEVTFTIPGDKAEAVIKGLAESHKAGFRYPVMSDLRHRPALAPFLEIPKGG